MMNILLAGNIDVYFGMEVTIYSLLKYNRNIHLYILTSSFEQIPNRDGQVRRFEGLGEQEKNKISNIVKYFDPQNSTVEFIDPINEYKNYLEGGINEFSGFTPYAAFRLLADLVLPEEVHDILYLDCDTVIQGSIESMYKSCQMSNYYCLASYAEDACEGDGEMVSGVMFFNLDKIRQNNFLNLARQNYKRYEYRYPDQMAMRDAGEIGHLSEEYGWLHPLDKYAKQPIIIHFTNGLEKIYSPNISPLRFYRLYPQLKWIQKGLQLIDIIKFE